SSSRFEPAEPKSTTATVLSPTPLTSVTVPRPKDSWETFSPTSTEMTSRLGRIRLGKPAAGAEEPAPDREDVPRPAPTPREVPECPEAQPDAKAPAPEPPEIASEKLPVCSQTMRSAGSSDRNRLGGLYCGWPHMLRVSARLSSSLW